MKRGMIKSSKRQEEEDMNSVLAELESSESVYFKQSFTQSQNGVVQVALPVSFVQEHGFKIDKWVILRTRTTSGTSSRPWVVELKIYKKPSGTRDVRFAGGWEAFAAHYQLKEGDSLIFLLSREGARSEFEVYVFGETGGGSFSFLDLSDSSGGSIVSDEEEEEDESVFESKNKTNLSVSLCPMKATTGNGSTGKATTDNGSEGKDLALKLTKDVEFPSFRRRLSASSIQRSDGKPNSGQFEFPMRFSKTHGLHFRPCFQVQGVHEDSPIYNINCRGFKGKDTKENEKLRSGFKDGEWSTFVQDNDLKEGQVLQFSLIADSYFVVRVV